MDTTDRTLHVNKSFVDDDLATILEAGPNWEKAIAGKGLNRDAVIAKFQRYLPGLIPAGSAAASSR